MRAQPEVLKEIEAPIAPLNYVDAFENTTYSS